MALRLTINIKTMKPTIINLTPHAIVLVKENGEVISTFPPSGQVARVTVKSYETSLGDYIGVPTTSSVMGEVTGLPVEQPNVWLITSQIVAAASKGLRNDILHPGELVRNQDGQPIGCRSLNML